jgi:hypothetical protein
MSASLMRAGNRESDLSAVVFLCSMTGKDKIGLSQVDPFRPVRGRKLIARLTWMVG